MARFEQEVNRLPRATPRIGHIKKVGVRLAINDPRDMAVSILVKVDCGNAVSLCVQAPKVRVRSGVPEEMNPPTEKKPTPVVNRQGPIK